MVQFHFVDARRKDFDGGMYKLTKSPKEGEWLLIRNPQI